MKKIMTQNQKSFLRQLRTKPQNSKIRIVARKELIDEHDNIIRQKKKSVNQNSNKISKAKVLGHNRI